MKISTKRGDDGKSQSPLSNDAVFEYLGTVDELQSILGVIDITDEDTQRQVDWIQDDLYKLMCFKEVEPWFDTHLTTVITEFVLPKGYWHLARTVCRRAERRGVAVGLDITYLNRLSDFLYKIALNEQSSRDTK